MMDAARAEGAISVPAWCEVVSTACGNDGFAMHAAVAEETPIAFRFSGLAHAVMMATAEDVEDFAFGFALTEGAIQAADEINALAIHEQGDGVVLDIGLQSKALHHYLATRRMRHAGGHTSCGICGVEDLAGLGRPAEMLSPAGTLSALNIRRAADDLRTFQHLSLRTHAAHAAAWVDQDGAVRAVREDVGRHNALDKLIGAGMRGAFVAENGFCLVTSRCSFEMVQKAVIARFNALVSISAPTALAIRTAAAAGLTLISLGRGDGPVLFTSPSFRTEK
jgi:FdhD protein